MLIKADVTLPYSRERVFLAYRDRMTELTDYLPNIRSIVVKSRQERPGEVELVNEWIGGGDVPKVARAVIREDMLRWTDYATWKDATHTVAWRTEVHAFPGVVKSSGENRFVEVSASEMRVEIRGDLTVDSARVPGVPRLFANTVNAAVEKMLVGQVQVNLVEVGKGVGKLLARDG